MAIKMSDIAAEYRRALFGCQWEALRVLRRLLVKGLAPQQRDALRLLKVDIPRTAADIAEELNIEQNHACNLLTRLRDLHLARRESRINERGLTYLWYYVPEGINADR